MADLRRDPPPALPAELPRSGDAPVDDRLLELAATSADLEITAEELDAIIRLLGDDLTTFFCKG